ncbi:polysaccharide biosynthesis tyrosine autokinase [Pedobacter aquatilis]|uniref:GumC family protein n=1 Tax=Pedobacter aquatilis TaxID=351343 RepID=UPI0025B2ADA0|nr:polysaccharide biosynthesis tyrosine autokinase [Pedobacter aquatilis]MDN3586216.1 polysaccharide biosynthesis tyrosine autokinase [Pedobacter aquatilis]
MDNTTSIEKNKLASQNINYWKIALIFLSRWYWVAGTVLISFILAWLYVRSITPIYITSASLKLDGDHQQQMASLPGSPVNYRPFNQNQIQTEGIIMRSEDVILNALKNLDYKISYYLEGRVRVTELYPKQPFQVDILTQDSVNFSRATYSVKPIDNKTFELSSSDDNNKIFKKYRYGQAINAGNMVFTVKTEVPAAGNYSFRFNGLRDLYGRAAGGLNIFEQEKNTFIMGVTHTDSNPVFSANVLNEIIKQYVKNDAQLKKRSARQTIDYLDSQIAFLDDQVNKSGNKLSSFQSSNKLIDPNSDRQIGSSKLSNLQNQIAELQLQELGIQQLEIQVKNNKDRIQLNLNLEGTNSTLLTGLITQLNDLILTRENKLQNFNADAPPIQDINRQINEVKQAIVTNIRLLHERNQKTINYINGQIGQTNHELGSIPAKQNDFAKLQSNFDINQRMFSMLFERKLSAQISSAAVIAGATIISGAQPSFYPISPVPKKIYSSYLFMGLFSGLGLILLVRILNPYLYDIETIEGLTATPIIGVILKYPKKVKLGETILSIERPKSIFAESVRSVRTNLSFMASDRDTKVICITSEVSGEGKSFVSINLAGTLSIIEKKVIIIAADLRKSKLHYAFGSDNQIGLSNYLSKQASLSEIIFTDERHHIDYITSGPVPPNPSELLHHKAMETLIENLRETYEYIIIDTAPVGLVSDSIPLIRKADVNLFIIRSGVSKFRAATIPDRLSKEYGLNNIAIILNSFGDEKLHANIYTTNYAHSNTGTYYYSNYTGYGKSGYYDDEKSWWEFWKKKG